MIAAVTTRPCKQLTKRIGLTLTKPTHQVHPDYRRYNKTLHQLDPEVAQAARLVRVDDHLTTQFTCFTSTKVQIVTPETRLVMLRCVLILL